MSSSGYSPRMSSLDGHRGLAEDRVLAGNLDLVAHREVEDVGEERGGADLVELQPQVPVEDAGDVVAQRVDGGVRLRDPDAVEDPGHGLGVAQRDRHEQRDERLLHGPPDAPHQSEVEEGDPVPGEDEDVPGVRVPVEDPATEELAEGRLDEVARHLLRVVTLAPREVGHLEAIDEVEREHGRRGVGGVNAGDDHEREVAGGGRHVPHVAGLVGEVELLVDGAVELLDDVGRGVDARLLHERLEQPGDVLQEPEVGLELLADARTLDLDRDVGAGVGARPVHLRDRRAGRRHGVEPGEDLVGRAAEAELDLAADGRDGHGLAGVLEQGELGDPRRREDVAAAGEQLPELHVGGAQVHEHLAEARRVAAIGGRSRPRASGLRSRTGRRGAEPDPLQVSAEAVAGDDRGDLAEAVQVVDGLAQHRSMLERIPQPRNPPGGGTRTARCGPAC